MDVGIAVPSVLLSPEGALPQLAGGATIIAKRQRDGGLTVAEKSERATRRRAAMQRILDASGLTVQEATRRAGLKPSGAIGNFLRSVSDSLNLNTLEPLAEVLHVSVSELIGDTEVVRVDGDIAYIRGASKIGAWERQYCLENKEWQAIVIPRTLASFGGKSYFLTLDSAEMNLVYPDETVLEVIDLEDHRGHVVAGNRVIITRTNQEGYVETSCREVVHAGNGEHDGSCTLVTRSSIPEYQQRVLPWPWPIVAGHVETAPNGDQIQIKALVVRTIREEISSAPE